MREDVKIRRKIPLRYLAITVFCLIVSVIYSRFSHGIHSFWMRYLALWPLVFGLVPALLEAADLFPFGKDRDRGERAEAVKDIYRFGIAAVIVSSFLKGVLEIAGTDSVYPSVLLYAGGVMLLCGAVGLLLVLNKKDK